MPQVLLNAFGRALKDAFPFARAAALHALVATQKYYTPEEMACRALPAVTPLAVDPLPGGWLLLGLTKGWGGE
jgi:SCY1-like protein 1